MEEIILPIEGSDKSEKINPDASEINIAKLLSCSQRTIKSYIEKGILPKPVSERDGILYFSRDAVVEAMGLKNLDEVLVSFEEARRILGKMAPGFKVAISKGIFTEIKLAGFQSKRFYLKREIEEYDVEIEFIRKPLPAIKENKLIKLILSDEHVEILKKILTPREADILKKVYVDKLNYVEIGEVYDLSSERVRIIFEGAMMRFENLIGNIIPLFKKNADRASYSDVIKKIDENYKDHIIKLENHILYLNKIIKEENETKVFHQKLVETIAPPNFAPLLPDSVRKILKTEVKNYNFSARLMNCLKAADIEIVQDIVEITPRELLLYPEQFQYLQLSNNSLT